jgi:dihydrofolate synthase/folylpolyglutamate synthase
MIADVAGCVGAVRSRAEAESRAGKINEQRSTRRQPPRTGGATPFARYFEAVDYLQRRLWHELPIVSVERALQHRVRQLLAAAGDPHERFPVIHVGGSAGKGSTSTIAASLLRAAGCRTALYTSPHLQTFIERADVDGRLIPPDEFAENVLSYDPLVRKMHVDVLDGAGFGRPSLVEVAFAASMRHFASARCDAGVIEVGLGGRTDCTNVLPSAPVRVITTVDYEHRERLGWTLSSIAREKSAIINGGVAIAGPMRAEALRVIERRCAETSATLLRFGRDIRARVVAADADGVTFDLRTPWGACNGLRLALAGEHQATNAALAVSAALAFVDAIGGSLTESRLRDALGSASISARMERVQASPAVVLDGAHNPVEARVVARELRRHWLRSGDRAILVLGILADKDQASMARALAPVTRRVIVTQPPIGERTGDPDRMLRLFGRSLGPQRVAFEPSHERAVDLALQGARAHDVVCVTGSMFLVGAVRNRWVPEQRILERRTAALGSADGGE